MSLEEELANLLRDGITAGSVDEERIDAAEQELGVRFPPSYRRFLRRFGAAVCGSVDLAGLFRHEDPDSPPMWQDVLLFTRQIRRASRGLIPDHYLPISGDGGDYTFYLATEESESSEECPVVVLGPGRDGVVVALDFADFAVRWIKDEIVF